MLFYFFLGSCCKLWKEKGEKKRKKADIPFLPPQAYLPLYRKSSPEWAKKPTPKNEKANMSKSPNNFPAQLNQFEMRFLRPAGAPHKQLFCLADLICLKLQC